MSSVDVESRTLPQFVEQGEPGVTRIACAAGSAMAAALKVVTRRNMVVGGGDPIQPFLTFDCQPKLKMREWGRAQAIERVYMDPRRTGIPSRLDHGAQASGGGGYGYFIDDIRAGESVTETEDVMMFAASHWL